MKNKNQEEQVQDSTKADVGFFLDFGDDADGKDSGNVPEVSVERQGRHTINVLEQVLKVRNKGKDKMKANADQSQLPEVKSKQKEK